MKNFALFLTRGMSLQKWESIGSLEREIKPYQELAKYFEKIFIFSYSVDDEKFQEKFPSNVIIVPKSKYIPNALYSFLLPLIHYRILKNIQIIKTNQMDGSWSVVFAKKLFGCKLVVRCGYEWLQYLEKINSSLLKRKIAYLIEKFAYSNADKIIITSEEGREFIKNKFRISEQKINLIPNYVDTDRFKPLNLEKGKGQLVFVGRLDPVKNLDNLIRSMKGLNVTLLVIGEGPLRKDLEQLARNEGVSVEFKGIILQRNLPLELDKSEIFILPSISEGNPKVLLEAMSCGLPCLGSNILSISEIISDGENGVLTETDAKSIHNALLKLLNNQDLRKQTGLNARQTILDRFSFEKIIDKELKIYEEILR